jgi:GAF domain-containing protein
MIRILIAMLVLAPHVALAPDGRIRRLTVAHPDPEMVKLAHELVDRYPPDPNALHGPGRVIRTSEPEFVPEITDELLAESARDEEHLRIIRALGLSSYISVPLIARGEVLGALTLVTSGTQRRFDTIRLDNLLYLRQVVRLGRPELGLLGRAVATGFRRIRGARVAE